MISTAEATNTTSDGTVDDEWFGEDEVPVGSEVYNEVVRFLYRESQLLDRGAAVQWGELLDRDLVYTAPIRLTRLASDKGRRAVGPGHYDENYASIMTRISRLTETKSFWAEDPPSRTRRLVTNVLVRQGSNNDELLVTSNLLLTRSRLEMVNYHPLSAERRDMLRRTGDGLKLARREVIIDQSVVMMPNLAVFL